ncbi:hypothetical protein GGD63_003366 [Bradyrhizobium sp. cir1]|uniref:hypothetical protein n=1 Tax=Bradyrhizobium sp. cir1 TaxID=1445730 RepID=UPI001606BAFD|nr:hypothetical protein [Bradyrhizobium sp. cir1]MBB4370571.1 hypothetical protein [Bradyrhizobium sp. cir1]
MRAGRPKPSRHQTSFSGVELLSIVVIRDIRLLLITEEFGQRSGFAILLYRR